MKIRTKMGLRTLPWWTPTLTGIGDERVLLRATRCLRERRKSVIQEWSWPWIPSADSLESRQDARLYQSSRYVQRDGPNLMSDVEGLHPLLGE